MLPGGIVHKQSNSYRKSENDRNNNSQNSNTCNYISQTHSEDKLSTFGNGMAPKEDGVIRVASQNVGCLGIHAKANHKQDKLIEWLIKNQIDILGIQEVGVAFHMAPGHEKFHERIRDRRLNKIRTVQANNVNEKIGQFQWGGTAMIATNESANRVKETGKDTTGLGRWSHMLLEGKNNHKVRVVSAYNPCKSSNTQQLQTVYAQQKRYLISKGISTCPRLQFQTDLENEIKTWQQAGEMLIILMDFNENLLRLGPLQSMLLKHGLIDPIRQLHQFGTTPPPTSKTGSVPIDSIFVSTPLQHIVRGGWLRLSKCIGDHRPLFFDIDIKTILGENKFKIFRPKIRRLKCENPNIVQKFNRLLTQQLLNEKTYVQLAKLQWKISSGVLTKNECKTALQKIDNSVTHAVLYAEKKCRKLCMGEVPFSVERAEAGRLIDLWNNVIRKKQGWNISSKYIKRLTKKCNIEINPMHMSLEDCEQERRLARRGYAKIKDNARASRETFLDGVAALQAAENDETVVNAIRRIKRLEEIRAANHRVRIATKDFHGATERVLINDNGTNRITTDKDEIEAALRAENERKFRLAYSECPFLQPPLLNQLGQTAVSPTADAILHGTYKPPSDMNKYTKRFIQLLRMPLEIKKKGLMMTR